MKYRSFLGPFWALLSLGYATSFAPLTFADIKIMVLDSPVDYKHSWISPYIDTASMSRYTFTDTSSRYGSWKDLTDFYVSDYKLVLRTEIISELLQLLDETSNRKLSPEARKSARVELVRKATTNPHWGAALRIIGTYLHGTHVAGLTVQGQDPGQIKLITAPVFSRSGFEPFNDEKSYAFPSYTSPRAKDNTEQITRAISEQNVMVVNMSFGWTWKGSVEETLGSEISLFVDNPNTVFVLAAGNSQTDLSGKIGPEGEVFPQSKLKNVLLVAALQEDGSLSDFSNYGVNVVNIAAPGTSILSSAPAEKIMHMDGTSMAAPIVTNRIALVRLRHPELSAAESIQYLFENETYGNPNVMGQITQGRCLIMPTEVKSPDLMNQEAVEDLFQVISRSEHT
jgi:subtilisin family serine protease